VFRTEQAGNLIAGAEAAALARELRPSFAGELLSAGDAGYDAARTIWNAMIDRRPGLIAKCTSTEDVAAAVRIARKHDLLVSVRGGGHGVAGKSLCDGGLTIDLTRMRQVTVDPAAQRVRAGGGSLLGNIDEATGEHGLIVPVGVVSETGVAGLALGGGIGWFSRKHGLTCDNFESLEVVTAAGEVVRASEREHPDLFWGLHGGGGNFGVVTEFEFQAHRFGPPMRIGVSLYQPEDAVAALAEYARIYPELPDHVGWHAALKMSMPKLPFVPDELVGKRLLMLIVMYLDDAAAAEGEQLVQRLISVGSPATKAMTVMPFGARLQKIMNPEFPDGNRYYTKEAHINTLPEAALESLIGSWQAMTIEGEIELLGLGGAMARVPDDATAFPNRRHNWWINFALWWTEAARDQDSVAQIRQAHDALKPWLSSGIYANMLNFDEADRLVDAYGGPERYARLGKVKADYDPDNFFRLNANIRPRP
jgi:FAD/FMN-containing dehydrogenase